MAESLKTLTTGQKIRVLIPDMVSDILLVTAIDSFNDKSCHVDDFQSHENNTLCKNALLDFQHSLNFK